MHTSYAHIHTSCTHPTRTSYAHILHTHPTHTSCTHPTHTSYAHTPYTHPCALYTQVLMNAVNGMLTVLLYFADLISDLQVV